MIFSQPTSKGYSLIEVLVAVAILLIAIVGPMTIAATGLKNVQFAREQNIAIFLAQEGIEKVHQSRDEHYLDFFFGSSGDDWQDFVDDITASNACGNANGCIFGFRSITPITCSPQSRCDIERGPIDGLVVYTRADDSDADDPSTLTETPYRLNVFVDENPSGSGVLHVTSRVTWDSKSTGQSEQLELHSYIYNTYGL